LNYVIVFFIGFLQKITLFVFCSRSTEERLFQSRENLREIDEEYGPQSLGINRTGSQLSLRSPNSSSTPSMVSKIPTLPTIGDKKRFRRSNSFGQRAAEQIYGGGGKTRLPRRVNNRRRSESEIAQSIRRMNNMPGGTHAVINRENNRSNNGETKQGGNTTTDGAGKKKKHSRHTDPFENVSISMDRY